MVAVDYQNIYVAMETVTFLHTPTEMFLRNNCIFIKLLSETKLTPIITLLVYRVGPGSSQPIAYYLISSH